MNEYDSSKMADLLDATHGYQLTDVAEEADVLLLNTCSIREGSGKSLPSIRSLETVKREKSRSDYRRRRLRGFPEGEHIRQRAHYVDIIFGPQTLHRLPEMINSVRGDRSPVVDISFPEIEKFDRLPEPRAEGPTAFVSIMEGCNKYCTYCVVPYTRGEEVSRPSDDILFEIAQLAAQGVREVNLLGQNVNALGAEKTTTAPPVPLPICCVWLPPSTALTVFALPPAIRLSSPTILSRYTAIRRNWSVSCICRYRAVPIAC